MVFKPINEEELCAFCDEHAAEIGDYCKKCDDLLTDGRLKEEVEAMEADGILTEEDNLDGSNTGC
jgi:hypothetical protein